MEEIEVTEKEMTEYLGLSDRRIRQLNKQGILIKSQKGKYILKVSILNYINFLRDKEKNKNKNESLDNLKIAIEAEKVEHERLKKRKTELQVLQMEKKLHAQEDVEYFWNNMVMSAKSKLTALPTKLAPQMVGIDDRREAQGILRKEIDEVLNDLADYDVENFEDKDFGDDEED